MLIAFIALLAIYVAFRFYRRERLATRFLVYWTVIWTAMGVFAIYPRGLDVLGSFISMQDRRTFLFVASIVLLYVLNFQLSTQLDETRQKISRLVQEFAILEKKIDDLPDTIDQNTAPDSNTETDN